MSKLRPRLCILEKAADGYGFHLHGEKGKQGQFIRRVEPDSPAESSGLLAGDKLAFVNGQSVEGESHQQVVGRIRATTGALELVVVDAETDALLQKHGLACRKEFVTEGVPLPGNDGEEKEEEEEEEERASGSDRTEERSGSNTGSRQSTPAPPPAENGDDGVAALERLSVSSKEESKAGGGPRPRLCQVKKGATGYGFNLHSEKSRPGQFIRAVDQDSPADRAGLRAQDKIVQVNGVSVIGLQHAEVVAAIKAGGEETRLLVVDPETAAFFLSCNVTPTEEHLTGALPEPVSNGAADQEVNGKAAAEAKPKVSVSPSPSSASSTASLPPVAASPGTPPPEAEKAPEAEGLSLSLSLAQAKERAHQKRAAKKAPPMDWSKRNELFSNL